MRARVGRSPRGHAKNLNASFQPQLYSLYTLSGRAAAPPQVHLRLQPLAKLTPIHPVPAFFSDSSTRHAISRAIPRATQPLPHQRGHRLCPHQRATTCTATGRRIIACAHAHLKHACQPRHHPACRRLHSMLHTMASTPHALRSPASLSCGWPWRCAQSSGRRTSRGRPRPSSRAAAPTCWACTAPRQAPRPAQRWGACSRPPPPPGR